MQRTGFVVLALALALTFVACDSTHDASCAPGDFLYDDQSCPLTDGGPPECHQTGDLTLYIRCDTDEDCCDPARPYCSVLGLFNGGDWNCNETVRVCRSERAGDCTR